MCSHTHTHTHKAVYVGGASGRKRWCIQMCVSELGPTAEKTVLSSEMKAIRSKADEKRRENEGL